MEILVEIYPYWKTSVKRWFIESYNCWRSVCWTLNRILLHYTSTLSVFLRHTLQNSTGYILLFYLVNYFSHSQLNVSNPLVVDRSPCEFVEFRSRTRSHLYHECLKEQSHERFTSGKHSSLPANWDRFSNFVLHKFHCSFNVSWSLTWCLSTHVWQITSSQCEHMKRLVLIEHAAHLAITVNGIWFVDILKQNRPSIWNIWRINNRNLLFD